MKKNALLFVFFFAFVVLIYSYGETRGLKVIVKNDKGEFDTVSLYDRTKAILIAIDNYPDSSGIPKLSYCVKDSEGLKEILQNEYKFNEIVTLYNEKATKQGIIDRILKIDSGENDALLIFYAGHGYTETTKKGDKIGYIVPYDGSMNETDLQKNLDMGYIRDYISKKISAKHIFYIFDSCYSGTLFEKRGVEEKSRRDLSYLKSITSEPVIMGFTAGGDKEQVLDGGPFGLAFLQED